MIDPDSVYGAQVYDAVGPAEVFKFARHANKLAEYDSLPAPEIKVSTHTVYVEQDDGDAYIETTFNTEDDTNSHWY